MIYRNIDEAYNAGAMPLHIYAQLNDKTPQENYELSRAAALQQYDRLHSEQQHRS